MDRHSSTIKRHRQSLKRRANNRAVRSKIKTITRNVEEATSKEVADLALQGAIKQLDKAGQRNVIHPNKTARIKSRLTRLVMSRFAS